jgi:tetratricopeptide (TPR) repeat protein
LLLGTVLPLQAEECTEQSYGALVSAAKRADEGHLWSSSVELYNKLLRDCPARINSADYAKIYDALAVAELMSENYPAAIAQAKRCLDFDSRCNSCMMTAAKAYEGLGDADMAISYAKTAVEVGGYDDYSAAVVILAKDFLKKQSRGQK